MKASKNSKERGSLIGFLLSMPFRLIGWILVSWLSAVLIFSLIIMMKGHALGYDHCLDLLKYEWIHALKLNHYEIKWIHYLQQLSNKVPRINHLCDAKIWWSRWIKIFYPFVYDYIRSIIVVTQTLIIRLSNIAGFSYLMVLLSSLGVIHGFIQHYLRRINGGRESALIYHYAKASITACLFWGCLFYTVFPFPIKTFMILFPVMMGSSLAVFLTVKMFKKYT